MNCFLLEQQARSEIRISGPFATHPRLQYLLQKCQWFALLFLASLIAFLLAFARNDLAQHHHSVAVHESNTGQSLAILECVAHKWLLWLKAALSHLVRLQGMRIFHLFATSFLSHLPLQRGDAASGASASHETNR